MIHEVSCFYHLLLIDNQASLCSDGLLGNAYKESTQKKFHNSLSSHGEWFWRDYRQLVTLKSLTLIILELKR